MTAVTVESLARSNARPQHGNPAFTQLQIDTHLALLTGWQFAAGKIVKTFKFKNYYETMAFVNGLAWISHKEDHHPELRVHYNKCEVRYDTHSVNGLTENDFICAAKASALLKF